MMVKLTIVVCRNIRRNKEEDDFIQVYQVVPLL